MLLSCAAENSGQSISDSSAAEISETIEYILTGNLIENGKIMDAGTGLPSGNMLTFILEKKT